MTPELAPDYGLKLVLLEEDCPRKWTDSFTEKLTDKHPEFCTCYGTGRVPLLPAVRVSCWDTVEEPDLMGTCQGPNDIVPDCRNCDGRGWNPVEDGDVWAWTLWPILDRLPPGAMDEVTQFIHARRCGDTVGALKAAWQALVAAGIAKEEA